MESRLNLHAEILMRSKTTVPPDLVACRFETASDVGYGLKISVGVGDKEFSHIRVREWLFR
jgi:hypothetical protein